MIEFDITMRQLGYLSQTEFLLSTREAQTYKKIYFVSQFTYIQILCIKSDGIFSNIYFLEQMVLLICEVIQLLLILQYFFQIQV